MHARLGRYGNLGYHQVEVMPHKTGECGTEYTIYHIDRL